MIPLFKPMLLQKGDGSLVIELSLSDLRAELPVPEKYMDPKAEGFRDFYNMAIQEMMKGLRKLHQDKIRKLRRKEKHGHQSKRANYSGNQSANDGTATPPVDTGGVRSLE